MADQLRGVYVYAHRTRLHHLGWRSAAYYGRRYDTGLVDTKIKTTKINYEGLLRLFTKFSTLENYPLYGTLLFLPHFHIQSL